MPRLGRGLTRLLSTIYSLHLRGLLPTRDSIADAMGLDEALVEGMLEEALKQGLVMKETIEEDGEDGPDAGKRIGGCYTLTEEGRRNIVVVMTGGVFDIIHPGHLFTLTSSKRAGDVLVVSVARDETVRKNKGRAPLHDELQRLELVQSIRCVDVALLGSTRDIYETVEKVRPDVIVLGYDQHHDEKEIVEESMKRGVKVRVLRLGSPLPTIKSSDILKKSSPLYEKYD